MKKNNKKEKRNERYEDWKRRILTVIICTAIIAYIENWGEPVHKLIIEFSKVAVYRNQYKKVNHISIYFKQGV